MISMVRATPGFRRISPARSRVSTIWWTDGGLTPKCRCKSASAGGRPRTRIGIDEGQILTLLGRENWGGGRRHRYMVYAGLTRGKSLVIQSKGAGGWA